MLTPGGLGGKGNEMGKDRGINVLIVDDEERFRQTTAVILKNRGFEVKAAASGEEAVAEMARQDIDVVVMDLKMPGMDGNQALAEIKRIRPETEVIMLTAYGTTDSARQGLIEGMYDCLAKPCAIEVLAQKIRDASARKNALSEAERRVRDVMLPLTSFSTIREDRTVAEAIEVILQSFVLAMTAGAAQETVHRSILVMDNNGRVQGVITFTELLQHLQQTNNTMPGAGESAADQPALQKPRRLSGMFTILVRDLAGKRVKEIMATAPPTIAADADLMEAVGRLISLNVRRLLVTDGDAIVGVLREQDIFFEVANIVKQITIQ